MKNQGCDNNVSNCNNGSNFLIIVVLYILLAIMLSSAFRFNY